MATAKKSTVKKSSPHKVHQKKIKSFKISKETKPFVSYKITDQTIYWSILLILILVVCLWILQIQINISDMIDSIKIMQ